MALEKYNAKRDFKKTSEPKGIKKTSKGALRFVVQHHAASHLHYDFRLEIDGVLVSWAVPKGPSANPSDKRLAMHVEDHPMDYIDFEGSIPKGEYGGGTVMVWDIGTYEPEGDKILSKQHAAMKKQLANGSIKIVLHGSKLKGSWALVQMHGRGENQWLLIKHKDEFAGAAIQFDSKSILSNRDFDEIAQGNAIWHANKKSAKKGKAEAVKTVSSESEKSKKSDSEFTAADLANATKLKNFPTDWRPQLATLGNEPFDNAEWIFENKYDGYRTVAEIQNNNVKLRSRNGLSFNKKFSEIAKTLAQINDNMILDGEIVVEDANGKSHFQWLQHRNENPTQGTLKYYVFDMLYFQGYDLRKLELLQRKKILKALVPKLKNIVYSEHVSETGIKMFKLAQKNGGEGIIAKKITTSYHSDKRTKDWLKIKVEKQQEMVIGGFTDPNGGRVGIGALLCGYYDGKVFKYSGKVGTGFTESILKDLRKKLDRIERKTSPFETTPKETAVHWVKPELVAQIKFSEITEIGSMRHPVYLGLRADKKAQDITMELPQVTKEVVLKKSSKALQSKSDDTKKSVAIMKTKIGASFGRVDFTNTDKIFWPKTKLTKGDVIAHYDRIADYILPYLIDRPESLRRNPDGIASDGFFQKNVAGAVPKWIKTRKIKSESAEKAVEWLLCQDKETLLFLANYGCIEMNPWSSRVGSLNNPDYIIFDLDSKNAPMKNIVLTALKLKEILDSLHVPAFIKTSGGNGLHVFIPVKPKYSYEQTRDFSHLISQMVHRDLPAITSLERMPSKRKGKVYLDFLQNGKGKTMASIYSLRPREGAGVSTPLEWDEINESLDLKKFNINTIENRLAEKGDLWHGFFTDRIDLKEILKKI